MVCERGECAAQDDGRHNAPNHGSAGHQFLSIQPLTSFGPLVSFWQDPWGELHVGIRILHPDTFRCTQSIKIYTSNIKHTQTRHSENTNLGRHDLILDNSKRY